jgi:branched-chain amino acid transport system ATP-binding protein
MLEVEGLQGWYGHTQALFDVSFRLPTGGCVALVGTNGAGKTTSLRAVLGLIHCQGAVRIDGDEVSHKPTYRRVREHSIAVVHEGRGLLKDLTVRENLVVGNKNAAKGGVGDAVDLFPSLKDRLSERVSNLSGGQQQMVALGRAVLRRPQYVLLDEPSLGLAPSVIDEIYSYLGTLRETGLTMLLVEQSVPRATSIADRLCLLRTGRSVMDVDARDPAAVEKLMGTAFGADEEAPTPAPLPATAIAPDPVPPSRMDGPR